MTAWSLDWFSGSITARTMLAWRGVEAQHVVSTMRLVDTPAEQELLEQLLEHSKPPKPPTTQPKHYLLTTPFRYSPAHPSRFRPAGTRGQWYGAHTIHGACAEIAYWRHRFIMDSAGLLNQVVLTEHSLFQGRINGSCIDLTRPPWVHAHGAWTHGSDYSATHAVAAAAQERQVQWLRYESVRAPGEHCAVVFDPNCLHEPRPGLDRTIRRWACKATRESVMFTGDGESFVWSF